MADEIASLLVRITADGSQAVGVLNGIQATVGTLTDKNATMMNKIAASGALATKVGTTITKTVGVATVAGLVASAKAAGQLNKELANIGTLSVPTDKLKQYKGQIQDIAIATGKSTSDIAEGTYQVVSAFGDSADTMEKVEINAKAARAGLATTADSIALTSAVTKAYGDTSAGATQKVADLAFKTVELGQTTFPELAQSMQQVTSLSKELGVSQEELFGAYATLTGVTGNAAEVQTQMKAVYTALLKPSENMTKAIKKQGFESGYSMIKTLGFAGTLDALKKATNGSEEEMLGLFNNVRAMPAVMALTGAQYDTFNQKLGKMKEATGAASDAFAVQTEGIAKTGFTLEQAKVKMQVAAQRFGESAAPIIADFAGVVDKASDALANMSDEQRKGLIDTGLFITKLGVGLTVGGKIAGGITKIHGLISAVGKALSGAGEAAAAGAGEAATAATTAGESAAVAAGGVAELGAAFGATAAASATWAAVVTAPMAATYGAAVLASKAVDDYYNTLESSGAKATEEAENYAKVSREAFDMSEAAKSVENYVARYNELKSIISASNATDAELAELKATEQWFIDNYGQFISAEEQKNGIRQTTIDLINQMAKAEAQRAERERAHARMDLYQNQSEYKKNAAAAIEEISQTQHTIDGYKRRIEESKTLANELTVLQNKYNAINNNEGLTAEQRRKTISKLTEDNRELLDSYERLTGGKLYLPELEQDIQNINSLTEEWSGKLPGLEERISNLKQSVKQYGEALAILGGAATGEVLDDMGFGSVLDLFQNGSTEQVSTAIDNLSKKMKLLGFTSTESAAQVAYFKNGFNDLQSAIQAGALDAVVNDFINRGKEVGLTTSEIVSNAALLKNGFQNINEALASGDLNGVINDLGQIGAQSGMTVVQIDAIAHSLGLIPDSKHIEINADGNFEVVDGALKKLHELETENVHVSVNADGDITILSTATGEVKNLHQDGAATVAVNADGNIDVLDEAGNKLAEIKNNPSATVKVETEVEEPSEQPEVTVTANTEPAKSEIDSLNQSQVTVPVNADVSNADSKIKGLNQTVEVTVHYTATGDVPQNNATGTQNFPGGLAMVNDQRGISDPRELIVDKGRAFIPQGRDVILPLSKGAKVYTAAQTKAIMSRLGIPQYAEGKNNSDAFTSERDDWTHYTRTHAVTTEQELEKYLEFQEKYKENEKDIWDIEEQIFSLRQKQFNEQMRDSEKMLAHQEKYNGMAVQDYLAGIDDMRTETAGYYEQGIISHKEYRDKMLELDEKYFDKQKQLYDEMLEISTGYADDRTYFNDWENENDNPIDAFIRVRDRELAAVGDGRTQAEAEKNIAEYGSKLFQGRISQSKAWLEEQRKYFNLSDADYAAGIERMKAYTQEYYDNGIIGAREYHEAMTELRHLELDEAENAYETMLQNQQSYISEMRDKFSKQEQALRDSWEVDDRKASIAELTDKVQLWSGAVTERGKEQLKQYEEQLKQAKREEELYNLQKSNNAVIEKLEKDYKTMEADKKKVIAQIATTDVKISGIVDGFEKTVAGQGASVVNLLQTLIKSVDNIEIKGGDTLNDNRKQSTTNYNTIYPQVGSIAFGAWEINR